MFPHPVLIFQFEEMSVTLSEQSGMCFPNIFHSKGWWKDIVWIVCNALIFFKCSIQSQLQQIQWFPAKFPASDMQIGFIVIWFCVLCYLLLFAFCLPNIQLVFYLSDTFSLLFPLGVNFHSLQDNTSIPLTCYIQGIWYSYLLFLLWTLSLHSGLLSYRGMDRTFWSSSHAVHKELDFLPFDFRVYLRMF